VLKKSSGVRFFDLRDPLGRADRNNFAAFIASFGSEIDDPVGALNYFEIMLDHNHRMPGVD
jgi:hypothetical protein